MSPVTSLDSRRHTQRQPLTDTAWWAIAAMVAALLFSALFAYLFRISADYSIACVQSGGELIKDQCLRGRR